MATFLSFEVTLNTLIFGHVVRPWPASFVIRSNGCGYPNHDCFVPRERRVAQRLLLREQATTLDERDHGFPILLHNGERYVDQSRDNVSFLGHSCTCAWAKRCQQMGKGVPLQLKKRSSWMP